ncbi:alkaline phosphatase family protein [Streptomyces sp. NBC_01210]|uniref:alkaline phosphatase family protein n=1 Tax=Streptomyces sp. NBC_01210 TaxID=2903774 RepID=UPI002E132463|nr:alkaline phosphatase family protein [Streptomyces sp. NBC_01210]
MSTNRNRSRWALTGVTALMLGVLPGALTGVAHAVDIPTLPNGTSTNKVLVVGMDGLRHDRIMDADAPNMKQMMDDGTFGTSLLYCPPYESGSGAPGAKTNSDAGWSTVATGVWPDKHGITHELTEEEGHFDEYPGFMPNLEDIRPSLSTFSALDWLPLDDRHLDDYGLYTSGVDAKIVMDTEDQGLEQDTELADAAESVLLNQNPDAAFVYFSAPDLNGHEFGVGSQQYLDAIHATDAHLGALIEAIEDRGTYDDENWTVIVTTDHGMDGYSHGTCAIEDRRTFVLATGPDIDAGARPVDTRPTDVAATVYQHLGIPLPGNLDGKPLQQDSTDDFDDAYASLTAAADETHIPSNIKGFTHTPVGGWSVDNSHMPANGTVEWRGWTLTTDEFWSRTAPEQEREHFTRGRGVIAVADPDEWDDKGSPSATTTFDSTLVSPSYDVEGESSVTLTYASHYRQDGLQTGQVLVSFDNGPSQVIKTHNTNAVNRIESLNVNVPAGAEELTVKFRLKDAKNDWYWAIDNVQIATPLPTDVTLVNGAASKCIDLPYGATTTGTQPTLYTCHGLAHQRWTFQPNGTLTGKNGVCLDATSSTVDVRTCNGTAAQNWQLSTQLTVTNTGRCLAPNQGNTTNGTKLALATCTGTAAQRWTPTS